MIVAITYDVELGNGENDLERQCMKCMKFQ